MAAVTAGGVAVGRALAGRGWPGPIEEDGWQIVTIYRSHDELAPGGRLPPPVAQLGEGVEVRLRPAPGGKGSELAVRRRHSDPDLVTDLTSRVTGDDPRQAVRAALWQTKQLAETGEVLLPDRPPTRLPGRPSGAARGPAGPPGGPTADPRHDGTARHEATAEARRGPGRSTGAPGGGTAV